VAIVQDAMHRVAASHPVRVPGLAAGSAVLVRAAVVVRTDSAKAIDPVRAVAAVVPDRDKGRDRAAGLALVVVGGADAD
jgi:hypothetical protein